MPNYVPSADNVDRPVGGDVVRVAEELRAIKQKIAGESSKSEFWIDKRKPTQKIWPVGTSNDSDRPVVTDNEVSLENGGYQCFVCEGGTVNWSFDFGESVADEPGYILLRIRNGGLCTHVWPAGALFSYGVLPLLVQDGVDYIAVLKPRDDSPVEICHSVAHLKPLTE